MITMETDWDAGGYLLEILDGDDALHARMVLTTAGFEPVGKMAEALADISDAVKALAEETGRRLEERSAGGPWDMEPALEESAIPTHIARLGDYTFVDGSADIERVQRHCRRLLDGKGVYSVIPAVGNVARIEESFVGRMEARQALLETIQSGPVMLLGPRRGGKTSLLHWLIAEPPDGLAPVYINLESILDPLGLAVEMASAFLAHPWLKTYAEGVVGKANGEAAPSDDVRMLDWKKDLYQEIGTEWREFLHDLVASVDAPPFPLLLLDEFGDFLEALHGSETFEPFVEEIRDSFGLMENRGLVITGSRSLTHLIASLGLESSFGSYQPFPLPRFDSGAAAELFNELLRGHGIRPSREIIARALDLVGHQAPYFIQMLAAELMNKRRAGDLDDPSLVESAYQDGVLGYPGQAYFKHLEQRLRGFDQFHRRRASQRILRLIAEREEVDHDTLEMHFQAEAGGPEGFAGLLALLEEYFFLERVGRRYRFQAKVMRDYALKYYPPSNI